MTIVKTLSYPKSIMYYQANRMAKGKGTTSPGMTGSNYSKFISPTLSAVLRLSRNGIAATYRLSQFSCISAGTFSLLGYL